MAFTHGYSIIGDGHTRGNKSGPPNLLDPAYGLLLQTINDAGTPAQINTIIRGVTSTAKARVTRVVSTGILGSTYEVEMFSAEDHSAPPAPPTFHLPIAFVPLEALTYDTGGGGNVTLLVSPTSYQGTLPFAATTENAIQGRRDALFNSFLPSDGSDDPVFWDRSVKDCRRIRIAAGWTQTFAWGERIAVRSGGSEVGQFTVWKIQDAGGGARDLWIIRRTGTIAAGNTLRNITTAQGADHGTIDSLDAEPVTGKWKRLSFLPNDNGLGVNPSVGGSVPSTQNEFSRYELIPHGDGSDGKPGYGPMHTLLRRAQEKWETDADVANRHVRGFLFDVQDYSLGSMGLLGGVSLQAIEVSGGTGTFTPGETVSSGTWSGKFHSKTATRMWVHTVNGQVLAASTTITGASSGATTTATTTAHGWQPGSLHWQNLVAERTAALAAPNANHAGTTRQEEGVFLQIWETEIANFVTGGAIDPLNPATYVSEGLLQQQWELFLTALRTLYGNPTLPITLWQHDDRSHANDVTFLGYPWSKILNRVFSTLSRTLTGVALTTSTGMEGASATALPYPSSLLWLRPDDYLELGARAWRSLQFAATPIPPGQWRPMLLFILDGQSNMVGSKQPSIMDLDKDPDLWKSASFPGVSTIDVNVWQWNASPNVQAWEPYDIALNGNPFFDQFGFSPVQAALAQRMKRRFELEGVPCDIGFIPIAVNGASVNASSAASVTLDPDAPPRLPVTASQTVTVFGTTGSTLNPKRGRFTAAAPIYLGQEPGQIVQVSGSALGFLGAGGNNHTPYALASAYAVDPAGFWIEVVGEHVAETATFTLTLGKFPAWPLQRDNIRAAMGACATQLQRVPVPKGIADDQGESDMFNPAGQAGYEAAKTRHLNAVLAEFGLATRGGTPPGIVIVRQTSRTPWGTDQQVAAIRAAQEAVVAAFPNAAIVNSDGLQMEIEGAQWPRTTRQQNNVHRTLRALIDEGYLIDRAFSTLQGFPAHPDGEVSVAVGDGATDGGIILLGAGGGTDGGTDGGSEELLGGGEDAGPGDPLVVETGEGLANADSYLSLAEAETRIAVRGAPTEWTAATDGQKNDWLRRAAALGVDLMLEPLLAGYRTTEIQALAWPRRGAGDTRTGRRLAWDFVPDAWKWIQVEWAASLAMGVDPLRTINPADSADSSAFAIQTTDKLPGGFEESRTYAAPGAGGRPVLPALTRIWMLAAPFLLDTDSVDLA